MSRETQLEAALRALLDNVRTDPMMDSSYRNPRIIDRRAFCVAMRMADDALAKPESQPTCARDCPLCSGEACGKCGAGLWRMPAADGMTCNHDSAERHEEPASAAPLDLGVKERLVGP